MPDREPRPNICDYEGSDYRIRFWDGKGRDYEDRVERVALRRLLPARGRRLLEVGAGFGRLTDEYHAYEQVVLLDYSLSQLQYAQEHLGTDDRYVYVAADAYHLPFRPGVFDGATMIRVIHHISDAPSVLAQVRNVLVRDGVFILEHANKRNLKAMVRYAMKRQTWSPYSLEPVEFVELNFDFHPEYIRRSLVDVGFKLQKQLPVSLFRLDAVKRALPLDLLVGLDGLFQLTGLLYAPSVFMRTVATGPGPNNLEADSIFACPECGGDLVHEGETIYCPKDDLRWAIRDGIYDFKATIDS
ncbi:MAG: methyltransferase domain-containing protein [Anaerolineae bacterium]|nr:methyltransferase domain-containing protein [Anaerolineae bacterium]